MPNASFIQTSFLGGEWSSYSQGRMDSERYKTAMNRCLNSYALEEGAWTRRSGTRLVAHTKGGNAAQILEFAFSVSAPYQVELGTSYARFFLGSGPVLVGEVELTSISTASPAVVTTDSAHGWATGDHVMFRFNDTPGTTPGNAPLLRNRQFVITVTGASTFTIADAISNAAVDGSLLAFDNNDDNTFVSKIFEVVTPYTTTTWANTRKLQSEDSVIYFNPGFAPQEVTATGVALTPFAWAAKTFIDGPYLDHPGPTVTTTLDPSAVSGSVTLVASATTGINDGQGFLATDVGRLIRLLWEPAAWSSATTYAAGDLVKYTDQYFVALTAVPATAITPERDVTKWAFATDAALWTWGTITARASTTSVTFRIDGDALPDHTPRAMWQLGLFSDTTGWPKFGAFHDGRMWLGGSVVKNRIDSSKSNSLRGFFDFQPTLPDGTVADDNAISAEANSEDRNSATWILTDDDGIYVGSEGGEWRGRASANNDPISPSNFDFRRVSKYKCFDAEAVRVPSKMLFIQLAKRKIMEWGYVGQPGYKAAHLSVTGRHLTASGLLEIVYQPEPVPMVWARRTDGILIGAAYKRDEEAGYYAAWHEVNLGWSTSDRLTTSISNGASLGGLSEALWQISSGNDPQYARDVYFVEILSPIFEDDTENWAQWFVDSGVVPQGVTIDEPQTEVTFYGLWPLRGQTVTVFVGGIDFGDYLVGSSGQIVVPFSTTTGFTLALLQSIDDPAIYGASGITFVDLGGGCLDGVCPYYTVPAVIGVTFESRGQLLRPDYGNDAGAASGPAFSKIRRVHKYSLHAHRTLGLDVGIDFDASLRPAPMKNADGSALALGELYTGIIRGKMDGGYDTEGKIAWRLNRPYACTITAVGGFLSTQDE